MAKHSHFGNQSLDFHGQLLLWKKLSVLKRVVIKLQSGWMWRKYCRNHRWEKTSELNLLGFKFIQILLTEQFTNGVAIKAPSRHHISATPLYWNNIFYAEWGPCFSAVWTCGPSGHPGIPMPMARQRFLQLCFSRQSVGNYHLDIWKALQYCKMKPMLTENGSFLKYCKMPNIRGWGSQDTVCPMARMLCG